MARAYRLGVTRRIVNGIIRTLLRMGWGPARTYLLVTRGRTTGRLYRTPVTLVEQRPRRWLVAPYGEVGWVRNARAAGSVTLERGRRTETLRLAELGPRESARILQRYVREVPITRPYFDVTPDSSLDDFAAEAPRHPVFELLAGG
jgi:deazaflavin-dependent oxidoreductase (nitroreductase family)